MEHCYNMSWEYDGHTIIDCQTCGFKHVYPVPSQQELHKFYKETYFRDVKPISYHSITAEQIETMKDQINDNQLYQNVFNKVVEIKKNDYNGMVDIGCGSNLLSCFFRNRGWAEYVIEPSKDAGTYLKRFGLNVINEPIEKVDTIDWQKISFINVQFVLEHIANPLEILQKVYNLLSPGGIIRVCVPNDFSDGQMAYMENFKEKPKWICLPDHINYFNFESLSKVLAKVGFKKVYQTTDFPLELLLMSGMNYYDNGEEQQKVGPFIANFQESLINTGRQKTLEKFYESLANAGFGRNIYMYAIKEE